MSRIDPHAPTQATWLDMDLELAGHACLAQLPALAERRMRGYRQELHALQALAADSTSAQRLARKWFDLMANAAVHRGGADTLRPLFEHCSLVRTYLWLRDRVRVTAPEPLVRGTPDLLVEAGGGVVWIDARPRPGDVLRERGREAVLVLDRTLSLRHEPPLRLGRDYAGEFHLLDTRMADGSAGEGFVLERQASASVPGDCPAVEHLASATGASGRGDPRREADLENSA